MLDLKRNDISDVVNRFRENMLPVDRYISFDYCYNYFKGTKDLIQDMEKSCLVLGFFLASWGMFRGRSFLLGKSVKHFEETIRYISELDRSVWEIDVDSYTEKIEVILNIYEEVRKRIVPSQHSNIILTTKTLLGVFGFIPAFDTNFSNTFRGVFEGSCGFSVVNNKALSCIEHFYQANKAEIDRLANETFTTDFLTGDKTEIRYPKAKIIDMYGFMSGVINQ